MSAVLQKLLTKFKQLSRIKVALLFPIN